MRVDAVPTPVGVIRNGAAGSREGLCRPHARGGDPYTDVLKMYARRYLEQEVQR